MKGLVWKDLLCLRKGAVPILVIAVFYCVMAATGTWEASFLSSFLTTLVAVLPISCFSYDHAAKWDVFVRATPVGLDRIVAARYLTILLLTVIGAALALLSGLLARISGAVDDWTAFLLICAVGQLAALLLNAILTPLMYRYGAERGRIILLCVFGWVILEVFLIKEFQPGWLEALGGGTAALVQNPWGMLLLPLTGLVLLGLSYLVSVQIYRKREP